MFRRKKQPKIVNTHTLGANLYIIYSDGRVVEYDTARKCYMVTVIPRLS